MHVDRYKKNITFENGMEYVETNLENTVYLHIYIKTQNTILLASLAELYWRLPYGIEPHMWSNYNLAFYGSNLDLYTSKTHGSSLG